MSYLLDTNVWLERLLNQERSDEVGQFLDEIPDRQLAMTEFAYYSIGLALTHAGQHAAFESFVRDAFVDGNVARIRLEPTDVTRLLDVMREFKLDFDDAYQYTAAEKFDLTIISFDSDFDRTERAGVRRRPRYSKRRLLSRSPDSLAAGECFERRYAAKRSCLTEEQFALEERKAQAALLLPLIGSSILTRRPSRRR